VARVNLGPAGVPVRRARADQHPPRTSDRGAVARPLAGAAPGGGPCAGVTRPKPRVRLSARRAPGDGVCRAPKRPGIRGSPDASSGRASGRRWVSVAPASAAATPAAGGRHAGASTGGAVVHRHTLRCGPGAVHLRARPPGDGADARGGTDLGASARRASVGCRVRGAEGGGLRRGDRVPRPDPERLTAARATRSPAGRGRGHGLRVPSDRFNRVPRTSSRAGGPPERCGLPNGHPLERIGGRPTSGPPRRRDRCPLAYVGSPPARGFSNDPAGLTRYDAPLRRAWGWAANQASGKSSASRSAGWVGRRSRGPWTRFARSRIAGMTESGFNDVACPPKPGPVLMGIVQLAGSQGCHATRSLIAKSRHPV
jgi:hypothetical protein